MRLRRAAVIIPVIKGIICAVIGGSALASSFIFTGPNADLWPVALFVFSLPWLLAAAVYWIAAFLLARTLVVWRVSGALLAGLVSAALAVALVVEGWVQTQEPPFSLGIWPLGISIAIAALWIGGLVPIFLGAFRPPRSTPI